MSKPRAALDEWCKEIAPSTALRRWYGHDPDRFDEFVDRYRTELEEPDRAQLLDGLRNRLADGNLTLLTATRDPATSEARVLADLLS